MRVGVSLRLVPGWFRLGSGLPGVGLRLVSGLFRVGFQSGLALGFTGFRVGFGLVSGEGFVVSAGLGGLRSVLGRFGGGRVGLGFCAGLVWSVWVGRLRVGFGLCFLTS